MTGTWQILTERINGYLERWIGFPKKLNQEELKPRFIYFQNTQKWENQGDNEKETSFKNELINSDKRWWTQVWYVCSLLLFLQCS